MIKKTLKFIIPIFGLLSVIFLFSFIVRAESLCLGGYVGGYAWSSNIGWISFSCENEEGSPDYGVYINMTTGEVSGHAWSSNVGWITFNESDLTGCPEGDCKAWVDEENQLNGWAKVIDTDGGVYDKWISLSGEAVNGDPYGVEVGSSGKVFTEGYAWGDDTLGWIRFGYSGESAIGDGSGWDTGTPDGNLISLTEGDNWPDEFNDITFSAWIYWNGVGSQESSGIYLIEHDDGSLVQFRVEEDGELYLYLNGNIAVGGNDQTTDKVIREDRWTHVAFTYKNSNNWARIYVDGENVSSRQFNAGTMKIPSPGEGFHIIGSNGGGRNFNGKMTRIRIYHDIFE